jgi:hypothetical protein
VNGSDASSSSPPCRTPGTWNIEHILKCSGERGAPPAGWASLLRVPIESTLALRGRPLATRRLAPGAAPGGPGPLAGGEPKEGGTMPVGESGDCSDTSFGAIAPTAPHGRGEVTALWAM